MSKKPHLVAVLASTYIAASSVSCIYRNTSVAIKEPPTRFRDKVMLGLLVTIACSNVYLSIRTIGRYFSK